MGDLEEEVDRLYRLPLTEFVKARNDLAASLKKSGQAEAAKRVKELAKPSASAWAINQLYWTSRQRFDNLIAASDRYRKAQRAALAGDATELADAEREKRRAIEEAGQTVRRILGEGDPGAPMMRRIQTTLEALATYGSENPTPLKGRLTEDLEAPGFGALSSLAPPPEQIAQAERKNEARKDEEALATAKEALAKAMARAELQKSALESARAALERAEEEARRADAEVSDAKAALEKIEKRAARG
jgi:hypothetical protein